MADSVENKFKEDNAKQFMNKYKERYVAEAFSDVKLYLDTDSDEAYVHLAPTNLHKFQLPPIGCQVVDTFNQQDISALDNWQTDQSNMGEMVEINLIKQNDENKLGQMQRDEVTGEMYMLVPIEIDLLVKDMPCLIEEVCVEEVETIDEPISSESSSVALASDTIESSECVDGWKTYELHEITVPQLTLPLKLDNICDEEEAREELQKKDAEDVEVLAN